MNTKTVFHIPAILWLFLAGLFFTDFTPDKVNNINTETGRSHNRFEKYVDSLYNAADLKNNDLSKAVFERALTGYFDIKSGESSLLKKNIISIVDFTKPSTEKRLWIVDLAHGKLLYHTLVAHGKNTGDDYATAFSNQPSSNMSSLGFYVTGEIYIGKHGRSLALDGLEEGFNDMARRRAVVMHSADYVSESYINKIGRLGRSWGCPALPPELTPEIINTVSNGSCLYIYYPDKNYETKTSYNDQKKAIEAFNKEITQNNQLAMGTK
jgi:hypothetical protein